MKTTEEWI